MQREHVTHSNSAAFIGLVLALPFTLLILLLILDIEPYFGPLQPMLTAPASRLGSFVVFGAILLALVAFIINLMPIVRTLRSGGSLLAHPTNLVLAAAIFIPIITLVVAFIVDQYPCWFGVSNCD